MENHKIHFIGILANVDSSILNLNELLENEFEVRSLDIDKCTEFFNVLTGSSKDDTTNRFLLNKCLQHENRVYYIYNTFLVEITEKDDNIKVQEKRK